jgi:uracil-DNA glycosylase
MNKKIDLEEIRTKILLRLEPSGWKTVLKSFIESSDFEQLVLQLIRLTKDGKRFTPTFKEVFRAFEECPYDKLKVVMVGQDPYPQFEVADGIAFSCSKTGELQPSLSYLLNAINLTVYNGHAGSTDVDLTRWANQGVLLLNTALTTEVNKIGKHYAIWKPFIAYLFDQLTWNKNGLVYIYLGKQAQDWADCVNDNNYKFFLSHPASAAYNSQATWDSANVFVETRDIIKKNYNQDLIW